MLFEISWFDTMPAVWIACAWDDIGEIGRDEEFESCASLLPDSSCLGAGDASLDRGVVSVASSGNDVESKSRREVPALSPEVSLF
jgi:hypothetical protein